MYDILKSIRNILGLGSSDERVSLQNRKRRLQQEEYENYSTKLRRLNDSRMSYNGFSDDWSDIPSSSTSRFSLKQPTRRPTIRPLIQNRFFQPEIVNLCDEDDDVVEITPIRKNSIGHQSSNSSSITKLPPQTSTQVLKAARKTLNKYNKFFNGDDTIRLDEQQLYHDMLLSSPRTSAVYSNNIPVSGKNIPTGRRLFDFSENNRARKILNMLNDKKTLTSMVDLTADEKSTKSSTEPIVIHSSDSDSDTSSKRKVEPVNTFKRIVDTVPCMNPNYINKLEEDRKQKKKETERMIAEECKKREKFSDVNRENINLLLEVKVKNCKISDVVLLDEYSEDETLNFPEFTSEQESKINEALKCRNPNRLFVEKFNLRITGQDLKLFNEKEWLNDEVINFYVNMIQNRSQSGNLPKVYSFSTFFYPKLISSGYSSLRRWTKKVDIFSFDIIVVPVHLGFHWCMAIIDFRNKSIRYYDSMLGKNMQCLQALEHYLQEEHKDKKKSAYNTSDWKKIIMKDIPRQMNGSDCGVFSCTFAEFITRNAKILFSQQHMPYIRRKMVIEIINGKLLT